MTKIYCRVCLQPAHDGVDILRNPLPYFDGENITILEMFVVCTEIALQVGDDSVLCSICQRRLFDAYKFRSEAQTAIILLEKITPINEIDLKNEPDLELNFETKPVIEESLLPEVPKRKLRTASTEPEMLNRLHCRFCFKYIKGHMREHEQSHIAQNGGLECEYCGKKFQNRKLILEHIQGVHLTDKSDPNRVRYPCDICGRSYSEKSSLRNHKRDKHSSNPRIIARKICPYCGEPKKDMLKHIELVHSNKNVCYPCQACEKTYKSKESLRNHERLVHENIEPKHRCHNCNKLFRTNGELKSHINGVHGEDQQLPCKTCGKVLKSETTLRFHMKMHRATLDFKCHQCPLAFKTNAYLLKHMKVHSDSKDYICKFCSMAFKHSGMLSKHMRMHTGEFFYCKLCPDESFIDGYSLRMHNERVHLGITYRCDSCGKQYGTKKHLKQHQNAQGHNPAKWTKVTPEVVVS